MNQTNWLAILLCVVVAMGLGFLFYGALFQQQWMSGNGITMDGEKMFKNGVEIPITSFPMIVNTIAMLAYALFMDWLIKKTGDTTTSKGALLGAMLGAVLFISIYVGNLFANNPSSLTMVDGVYSFLLFTILGAILGGWRKK